jgi:hypothetical protein
MDDYDAGMVVSPPEELFLEPDAFVSSSTAPSGTVDRSVPKPARPGRGWCTCIARADADDAMPGNLKPGLPLFTFGTATSNNCPAAAKEAKRLAIEALAMKPKHVKHRCSD